MYDDYENRAVGGEIPEENKTSTDTGNDSIYSQPSESAPANPYFSSIKSDYAATPGSSYHYSDQYPAQNGYVSGNGSPANVNPYSNGAYTQRPTSQYYPPVQTARPNCGERAESYEVGKKQRKKSRGAGKIIALVAICLVVSCIAGAVCGYFTTGINNASKTSSGSNSNGSVVVYQSENTDSVSRTLDTGYTVSQIAEKVMPSVVEITTESVQSGSYLRQYITTGAGSGVIISEDGYIVTNNHVIESATTITVTLSNGESYPATLKGTDEETDIAVIKIEVTGLTPVVFGSSASLSVGDYAMVVGNPLGKLGGTVTDGIISALARKVNVDGTEMTLLQTSAAINPGNSGGGIFNSAGELIGIVNAKASGSGIEGLGFAIPIDDAKSIIEDLLQNGYVTGRVHAGIQILDVNDYVTAFQYRVSTLGPYVYSVESGSDAERAGLRSGDLIMAIDGKLVYSSNDIVNYFLSCEVGDTVTITIDRNGVEMEISLTFTQYVPVN